jgi:acyl dehydratase
MPDDPSLPPLPAMSAATLVRALFKRPSSPERAVGGRLGAASCITTYRLAHIDAGQLARYRRALGFGGTHVPLTYYYLLAQRAHLATMLGASFPFRLVGAIHVDNALSAGIQPAPGRPLDLRTGVTVGAPAANDAVHAVLDTVAAQDGELVFSCRSTYLVVRGRRSRPGEGARPPAPPSPGLAPLATWQLAPSSGRAYAALSGDWNPIHLWPWSARLMGMHGPIIHGMHTLGRACAELERAGGGRVLRLDGRFRAPVALGGSVVLAADLAGGRVMVQAAGRVAVEGCFDSAQAMLDAYSPS